MTGDQYGPYDPDTIKEERDRLKSQKVIAVDSMPTSVYHKMHTRVRTSKLLISAWFCLCHFGPDSCLVHFSFQSHQPLTLLQANAKARQQAEKEKLAKQAAKKRSQAQSQVSSGAAKIKNAVQDALPDSSSSDDSSSDSD